MRKLVQISLILFASMQYIIGQTCQDASTPVSQILDLTNVPTAGAVGSAGNGVGTLGFGSLHTIVGVSWTGVNIEPLGASWCSEPVLQLGSGLFLTFGIGEDNAGPCTNGYDSGGFLNLQALGIPPYQTEPDGSLNWEAFESYDDDDPATADQIFGSGTVTVFACPMLFTLPIELISFEGKSIDGSNLIEWSTANELNSANQIVEYSRDGRSQWEIVGEVKSVGDSKVQQNYSILHKEPSPTSYYRLREVSIDGQNSFSEVIVVKSVVRGLSAGSVFPNPVSDKLSISLLSEEKSQDFTFTITDITGKILKVQTITSREGETIVEIAADDLTSGAYILNIKGSSVILNRKFIKN